MLHAAARRCTPHTARAKHTRTTTPQDTFALVDALEQELPAIIAESGAPRT